MKTIWFELSKKLNDLWLLDNIETEYKYIDFINWKWDRKIELFKNNNDKAPNDFKHIKTLTLEEAIEFLPKYIWKYHLQINFYWGIFDINYKDCWVSYYPDIEKPTLLLAIEKMITFLINFCRTI